MKYIFGVVIFLACSFSYGFNWIDCSKSYRERVSGMGHWFAGIISTSYGLGEFSTSTGRCSSLADRPSQSEEFFYENFIFIKEDAARGEGEYLTTFAVTLGCNEKGRLLVAKLMQKDYSSIFSDSAAQPKMEALNKVRNSISNKSVSDVCSKLEK